MLRFALLLLFILWWCLFNYAIIITTLAIMFITSITKTNLFLLLLLLLFWLFLQLLIPINFQINTIVIIVSNLKVVVIINLLIWLVLRLARCIYICMCIYIYTYRFPMAFPRACLDALNEIRTSGLLQLRTPNPYAPGARMPVVYT